MAPDSEDRPTECNAMMKQSTLRPPWLPVRLRGGYMVQAVLQYGCIVTPGGYTGIYPYRTPLLKVALSQIRFPTFV